MNCCVLDHLWRFHFACWEICSKSPAALELRDNEGLYQEWDWVDSSVFERIILQFMVEIHVNISAEVCAETTGSPDGDDRQ